MRLTRNYLMVRLSKTRDADIRISYIMVRAEEVL